MAPDRPVADTEPLRLDTAARLAFPDGSMTAAGLRREARRGRLVVSRVAGKDYTTLEAIRGMIVKCRVEPKAPDYGCSPQDATAAARSSNDPCGSSEMGSPRPALVAALA